MNDPEVKFAVKRHYDDDNRVSKMIKNQNDYYPEFEHKLYEHDERLPLLEVVGDRVKLHNQAKTPVKKSTQGTGLKILTPKQMLQRLPMEFASKIRWNSADTSSATSHQFKIQIPCRNSVNISLIMKGQSTSKG